MFNRNLCIVLIASFVSVIGYFVFSDAINTAHTDFYFESGSNYYNDIVVNLTGGHTGNIDIYLENKGLVAISGAFYFVDGHTVYEGTTPLKACKTVGQNSEFGQYVSVANNSFSLATGASVTKTLNLNFPDMYSGVYNGCVVYGLTNTAQVDRVWNTAPYRAIFLDVDVIPGLTVFEVRAYPSNHINDNKGHDGKLYIYDPSDRTTPLYTGYLAMSTGVNGGTGAFVLDIPDGDYDIVYKARNGLASFLSGEAIQAGQTQIIDFTTGSNLYGTVVGSMPDWGVAGEMYQVVGDMPSTTQLNDLIDVGDVVNLISYNKYLSPTYVADEYDYYDLNGDSSVELADVTTILSNVGQKGVFYGGSAGTYGFDSNGAW